MATLKIRKVTARRYDTKAAAADAAAFRAKRATKPTPVEKLPAGGDGYFGSEADGEFFESFSRSTAGQRTA